MPSRTEQQMEKKPASKQTNKQQQNQQKYLQVVAKPNYSIAPI